MTIKVGIVYFSHSGNTAALVEALQQAVESQDAHCYTHRINGGEIIQGRFVNQALFDNLDQCEAIIFASPTYMGGVAAQFKAFADATSSTWTRQQWAGKYAAGITCGSSLNGDQSSTLMYLITLANQHGMLWIGLDTARGYGDHGVNRLGCHFGVCAEVGEHEIDETDLATARYLGARIVKQLRRGSEQA